jgi:hypothetical protein
MTASQPAIKQLDHVIARVDEPRTLFALLTETLGLPVAWPLNSYPAFQSGGIALGNLYLEILQCGPRRKSTSNARPSGRFCAVAFEATPIEEVVEELSRRKIPHTPVAPYMERGADGSRTKVWSNVVLGKLLGNDFLLDTTIFLSHMPGAARMSDAGSGSAFDRWQMGKIFERNIVFLVEYAYENFGERPYWSQFKNQEEKRAADLARLRAAGGGPLGLEKVDEITACVKDFAAARDLWRRLYAPAEEIDEGVWEIDDGPALRLIKSDKNSIQTLVLKVSTLERAETFLRESGMLGAVGKDQITIDPSKIEGLDVRLVQ